MSEGGGLSEVWFLTRFLLQLLTEVICFAYCLYMMVVFTQGKLGVCAYQLEWGIILEVVTAPSISCS